MSVKRLIDEEIHQHWLITYADLVTLLLVFFILLFSVSTLEGEQFSSALRAFKAAVGDDSALPKDQPRFITPKKALLDDIAYPMPSQANVPLNPPSPEQTEAPPAQGLTESAVSQPVNIIKTPPKAVDVEELDYLHSRLKQHFFAMGVEKNVEVSPPKDGKIRISVKGAVAFESGKAEFSKEMLPILDRMLDTMDEYFDYDVAIQGHTDDVPIDTLRFPTNWELSAVRATTVLRYFIRGGINPERLTATGYGESLPITDNDTEEHRADNRRIEFVLEKKRFN